MGTTEKYLYINPCRIERRNIIVMPVMTLAYWSALAFMFGHWNRVSINRLQRFKSSIATTERLIWWQNNIGYLNIPIKKPLLHQYWDAKEERVYKKIFIHILVVRVDMAFLLSTPSYKALRIYTDKWTGHSACHCGAFLSSQPQVMLMAFVIGHD